MCRLHFFYSKQGQKLEQQKLLINFRDEDNDNKVDKFYPGFLSSVILRIEYIYNQIGCYLYYSIFVIDH